jgi:hypothetical protein
MGQWNEALLIAVLGQHQISKVMEEVKPLRSTPLIKDKLIWKLSKHGAYTVKQRVSKAKASTSTSAREKGQANKSET